MSNVKVSELPTATVLTGSERVLLNQGGVTKTAAASSLLGGGTSGYEAFNVKDYGAVGDAAADDTLAIQAAIDACVAAGKIGGTVYIPEGRYRVTSTLVVPAPLGASQNSVSIVGDSAISTILRWEGPVTGPSTTTACILYLAQNATSVKNFKIFNTGARGTSMGLWFTGQYGTGGTVGGSAIFERVFVDGFDRGFMFGDTADAVSEILIFEMMAARCNVGLYAFGFNTCDITFILPEIGFCDIGLKTDTASPVQVFGGSNSNNGLDYYAGGALMLSGVRTENSNKFVYNHTGTLVMQACNAGVFSSTDKIAVEVHENTTIIGCALSGKIAVNGTTELGGQGPMVTLIGNNLDVWDTPDPTTIIIPMTGSTLRGTSLVALNNQRNAGGSYPNRICVFDENNVEHGLMQDVGSPGGGVHASGTTLFQPQAANPTLAQLGSGVGLYSKGGKLVLPYSNGGVLTFLTIPLDGATTTWTQTTTPP